MSSAAFPVPPQIDRLQRGAVIAGAVGAVACVAGGLANPTQFLRSYLMAYLFWAGIAIGCLSVAMIHHLSGGMWGLVIRRLLEAGTRTLFLVPVLFVPLALGLGRLYLWAQPDKVAADAVLRHRALYLNVPFFLGRAVFYFAAWCLLAYFLNKWSLALDAGPNLKIERKLRGLSGGGLVFMGLTITFSSVDWAMSLNPHWFSTIYGMLFMVGQALSALALAIVGVALLGEERPFAGVVRPTAVHDLGKLMLAFVMLWAYMHFSQFLITWSGNLPEEIPWYIQRMQGGWGVVGLLLVVLHFVLPFLLLLSRDLKRNAGVLAAVAGGVLAVRMLDVFWLVAPETAGHGGAFSIHWLDLAAPLAVGGAWVWLFAQQLKGRPLLPIGDPEIRALMGEAS